MRNNVITLLSILIFLTACGAQAKKSDEQTQSILSADSIESIDVAIEEEGFTLDSFDTNPQKMKKQNPSSITVLYGPTQVLNIKTHTLYSVTNEENQSIIVTIDNTLFDIIEDSPSFIIHHKLPLTPYGFTNLNTTLTDENSTITSILKEIEEAFTQKTLNNPSTQRLISSILTDLNKTIEAVINDNNISIHDENTTDYNKTTEEVTTEKTLNNLSTQQVTYQVIDDVNISYQTALKNHDETFECNGELKVIDAQKGYTVLSHLSLGAVLCTFGVNKIPMFDFNVSNQDTIPPIITLNGESNITLTIGDRYTELGATAIDNIDGNLSIIIYTDLNTSKIGEYQVTYSAKDKAGNIAEKSREINIKRAQVKSSTALTKEEG